MYAIIASGGKQYKVTAGDLVKVEKMEGNEGDKVVFDQVLLVSDKTTTIGNPVVKGAVVNGEIVKQDKDKKVIVYKYKPKSGYHKKNGHRQPITVVKIDNVTLNGVELVAAKIEEAKKAVEAKAEEVKEAAEAKAEEVKAAAEAKAEEVKTKVEAKAEEVKEAAEAKAEEVKAKVEEVKEAIAEKAESTEA